MVWWFAPIQTAALKGLFPALHIARFARAPNKSMRAPVCGVEAELRCSSGQTEMRWRVRVAALVLGSALGAAAGQAAPVDGQAAFARREDAMKHMGRPLYLGIGRVVKGKTPYGPDTIAAAETVAALARKLDWSLFPPGSDVAHSRVKPEIFLAEDRVRELIAAVQQAAAKLVPAVKSGDKAEIAAAYAAVNDACNACHKLFRKEEE
jgi:cytochrome c556